MQREFFWLLMASDVYTTVSHCGTCARNGTLPKLKRKLQLFPAKGAVEFVVINILGPLPYTVIEHQYEFVMTHKFLKLTQVMSTDKTSFSHVANLFFDFRVFIYSISAYVLTENGSQFTSKVRCDTVHSAWRKAPDSSCVPPSNEWAGRTIQSYNSQTPIALR